MALALHDGQVITPEHFQIYENSDVRPLNDNDLQNLYLAENVLHTLPEFSAVYAAHREIVAIAYKCTTADEVSDAAYKDLLHTCRAWNMRMPECIVGAINFPAIDANYNSLAGHLEVLYSTKINPIIRPTQIGRFTNAWLGPNRIEGDEFRLMHRVFIQPRRFLTK